MPTDVIARVEEMAAAQGAPKELVFGDRNAVEIEDNLSEIEKTEYTDDPDYDPGDNESIDEPLVYDTDDSESMTSEAPDSDNDDETIEQEYREQAAADNHHENVHDDIEHEAQENTGVESVENTGVEEPENTGVDESDEGSEVQEGEESEVQEECHHEINEDDNKTPCCHGDRNEGINK